MLERAKLDIHFISFRLLDKSTTYVDNECISDRFWSQNVHFLCLKMRRNNKVCKWKNHPG